MLPYSTLHSVFQFAPFAMKFFASDLDLRRLGGVKAVGPNPFFTAVTTPELWGQLQQEGWNMLHRLLPKVCLVFSHPHPDIAESVEPFLSEFLKTLRHFLLSDSGTPNRTF